VVRRSWFVVRRSSFVVRRQPGDGAQLDRRRRSGGGACLFDHDGCRVIGLVARDERIVAAFCEESQIDLKRPGCRAVQDGGEPGRAAAPCDGRQLADWSDQGRGRLLRQP
jgi:hypothetical protein